MATHVVCEWCKGWVNTEHTTHEVLQLHDGREVIVHYHGCSRYFKDEHNGTVKSFQLRKGKNQ